VRTITSFNAQDARVAMFDDAVTAAATFYQHQRLVTAVTTGVVFLVMMTSYGLGYFAGALFIARDRDSAESAYPLSTIQALNQTYPFNETAAFCFVGGAVPYVCQFGQGAGAFNAFQTAADVCACALCGCGCYASPLVWPGASPTCMQGGDVLTTFFALFLGSFGIAQAGPAIQAFNTGRVAAFRVYKMIDRKPVIRDDAGGEVVPDDKLRGEVELRDVVFTYPSRPDQPALRGLSLRVPAGLRVALAGESGSGKSTVAQLAMRFYDPDSGSVTLDGVDMRVLDVQFLRSCIGLVSQEPTLFALDVMENVRQGLPAATDEQVIQACKDANAHDFIVKFPQGYNTFVGNAGTQVSGGQKQRIAIARALLRKPRLLILDEATSALDSQSERAVNDAIERLRHVVSCTTIVIAHRCVGSRERRRATPQRLTTLRVRNTASRRSPPATRSSCCSAASSWRRARTRSSFSATACTPATSRSRRRARVCTTRARRCTRPRRRPRRAPTGTRSSRATTRRPRGRPSRA